jgi:hypothetical protein
LILNQYGTRETDSVKANTQSLGIFLLWVSKVAPGIYQPHDCRFSGALRAKGRAKWRTVYFAHHKHCDNATAGSLLREVYGELPDSVILAGWTFDETPVELDCDDSPDDGELALILASDSEEWDEKCSNLASKDDLSANKGSHFQLDDKQIDLP